MEDEYVYAPIPHQPSGFFCVERVADCEHVEFLCSPKHIDLHLVREPCSLEGSAEIALKPRDRREVVDPREADLLDLLEEEAHVPRDVDAAQASDDRRLLDPWQDLSRTHLVDETVGVAYGKHSRERTIPVHSIVSGVVDADDVCPSQLKELGCNAYSGTCHHDRFLEGDLFPKPLQSFPSTVRPSHSAHLSPLKREDDF